MGARRISRTLLFVAAMMLAAFAAPANAQAPYPSRPIRLIVPFPPGGPVDVMARFVVQRLGTNLGQIIIDNRPGAGGTLGSKAASLAEPDGYTLLFGSSTTLAAGPSLYRHLGYDPLKSFVPVGMISSVPFVLALAPHVDAKSLGELVAYAKAHPGKLNFGAPTGTLPHLTMEMFKLRAGVDIVHIPYKGAATAITDVLSGEMDMAFEPISVMVGHVREGKIRPLAVTGARAQCGVARGADRDRKRLSGIRLALLDRHRRAGRDAAGDHRANQRGDHRCFPRQGCPAGSRAARRRTEVRHTREFRCDDRRRNPEMGRSGSGRRRAA